jgi:hypothetical protein
LTKISRNRRFALAAALSVAVLAFVPAAFAGKGGGKPSGGGGSLSLVILSSSSTDGLPHYGDTVTFNVVTTNTDPHVALKCYQNTTLVYSGDAGFFASYPWPWERNMTLSSALWTGGGAKCTATLYYFAGGGTHTLATLSFPVSA